MEVDEPPAAQSAINISPERYVCQPDIKNSEQTILFPTHPPQKKNRPWCLYNMTLFELLLFE